MTPHLHAGHEDPAVPGHDPDDVMDLLARVESQFDRIRSIRRRQDEAVHSLAARTEALDLAEEELRQRERTLLDESDRRDSERTRALDALLDGLRHASDTVARRGRRIRDLSTWMHHAQQDRRRLRRRITGLRQAVRRLLHERGEHDTAQATIEQLRARLSLAVAKIQEFSEALVEQTERIEEGAAAMVEVDALRTRIRRLEQDLDDSTRSRDPEPTNKPDPPDEHLQRRRRRLRRCRVLLRDQARRLPQVAQLEAARRKQEAHLMEQQQHLDEVRHVLTTSEQRMIQRWAASRALHATGWCVLLLLLLAAGSWWAADRFDPPSMLARVALHASVPAGRDASPEAINAWTDWHIHLVHSDGFAQKLAARYQEQTGIRIDPELVEQRIHDRLRIGSGQDGVLDVSMVGRPGDGTTDWLDALARTLVSESARTARSRPNPLLAQTRNRAIVDGRERLATFSGPPIEDTRLRTAMLLFFAAGIGALVIAVSLYSHLAGAPRVMASMAGDDGCDPLLSDAKRSSGS